MPNIIKLTWPLFFGIAMMMLANGLQGTLLSVRANLEDFNLIAIGAVMSMYYLGYLLGSLIAPRLIKNVGHIRVFAAMASLASTTILIQGLAVYPVTWGVIRIATGFAYATIFIVIESWLNDTSTNKNRGTLLSFYMIVTYLSMFTGQFLLNLSPPTEIFLFVLTSILISFALIPISLMTRPAPEIILPKVISFKEVFKTSPTGITGVFLSGIVTGTYFSIAPVYGLESGFSIQSIAKLMAIFIMGGVIGQAPIGYASDKIGRRNALMIVTLGAMLSAFICVGLSSESLEFYTAIFFFGAFSLSIYPVCISYVNDYLEADKFIGVSAKLILIVGIGSFIGPIVTTVLMKAFGTEFFFITLAGTLCLLILFAIYRKPFTTAMDIDDQNDYLTMPVRPTSMTGVLVDDIEADENPEQQK